jgi:hypothetical protein
MADTIPWVFRVSALTNTHAQTVQLAGEELVAMIVPAWL